MLYMIIAHLSRWWLQNQFLPPLNFAFIFIEPFGASGFLFISGLSIALSFKNKFVKIKLVDRNTYRRMRNEYFFKALTLMGIALSYNLILGIVTSEYSLIWSWFILLTAAISLFVAFPLLHLSYLWRVFIGILIILTNQILLIIALPSQGGNDLLGVISYIFYSGYNLSPILSFFPFFLFGTVIGDLFYNYVLSDTEAKTRQTKRNFFLLLIISGIFLTILGTGLYFPNFMLRQTLSWIIHSLGLEILLIGLLLYIEEFEVVKINGTYRFIFYYSYYSLTVYLGHNLLALLFWNKLTLFNIWPLLFLVVVGLTYFLRFMYKWKPDLISIKFYIGSISISLAKLIEEKKGILRLMKTASSEINV